MPENLAGLMAPETPAPDANALPDAGEASVDGAPATAPDDIETTRLDERIKGFQRLIADRDAELARLREEHEALRVASLPDDEREAYARTQRDKEIEKLRVENEILRMSRKHPAVAEKYDALMRAASVEEQITLLETWLTPTTPATSEGELQKPAPVDRNNPVKKPGPGAVQIDGMWMDDAMAASILRAGRP